MYWPCEQQGNIFQVKFLQKKRPLNSHSFQIQIRKHYLLKGFDFSKLRAVRQSFIFTLLVSLSFSETLKGPQYHRSNLQKQAIGTRRNKQTCFQGACKVRMPDSCKGRAKAGWRQAGQEFVLGRVQSQSPGYVTELSWLLVCKKRKQKVLRTGSQ